MPAIWVFAKQYILRSNMSLFCTRQNLHAVHIGDSIRWLIVGAIILRVRTWLSRLLQYVLSWHNLLWTIRYGLSWNMHNNLSLVSLYNWKPRGWCHNNWYYTLIGGRQDTSTRYFNIPYSLPTGGIVVYINAALVVYSIFFPVLQLTTRKIEICWK